jgi:hypothetical protein
MQYLGQQLSTSIAREGDASAIEAAFLSSEHMTNLGFVDAHGGHHAGTPVGFQWSVTGADQRTYAARSYSLISPPRSRCRLIR